MTSPFAAQLIEDMREIKAEGLTREQYTEISTILARDCSRIAEADHLYFVIGNYDEKRGQKGRVTDTRDYVNEYRPYTAAFVLEDVDPEDEAWENWYVKFLAFRRRATHVVGVFEDNDGGHELEAGEVDTCDLYVLKRDYLTDDGQEDTTREHERYDGMLAKYFEFLDHRDRLYRWTGDEGDGRDDLETATRRLLDATVRDPEE